MSIELMRFDPATGFAKPYPSQADQWREWHGSITWVYNPFTGARRSAQDIRSDTFGLLITSSLLPQQGGEQTASAHISALLDLALVRMDRARRLLTDGNPSPECNWGMLDTSDLVEARAAVLPQVGEAKPVAAHIAPSGLGEAKAVAPEGLHLSCRIAVAALRQSVIDGYATATVETVLEILETSLAEAPVAQALPVPCSHLYETKPQFPGFAALASLNGPMIGVCKYCGNSPSHIEALPVVEEADYADLYRWLREDRLVNEPISYPTFPWVVRCELAPWPTSMRLTGADLDSAIRTAMQGEKA